MTDRKQQPELPAAREEPRRTRRRRSWSVIVWVVPAIAAGIAAWLVYQHVKQNGPEITIRFTEGKGLQAAQTLVRYRGVRVGEVQSVRLTKDGGQVEVRVRLDKPAGDLARDGAKFWIVRADVGMGSFRGLETIVGGPYIQMLPGKGPKRTTFDGLENGPVVVPDDEGGLDIHLVWPRLGWLNPGAPVYYRGIEVGTVLDYRLGDRATNIVIRAHIKRRFAPLVRANSVFWNAGGIKAEASLFGGVSVGAESLKSMLVGGIAFSTPSPPIPEDGLPAAFPLHEKAEDKWLKWSPVIDLPPEK